MTMVAGRGKVTPVHQVPFLTISQLGAAYDSGELSPMEATHQMLDRIEQLERRLAAFVTVAPERAMSQARKAEDELAKGRRRSPLHGVPIALKDLCNTAAMPTSAGTSILADWTPAGDSTVAARLDAAGAVLLGKLKMTEGAFVTHHPSVRPPVNPWSPGHVTGLSSSGSGVAVAAGLCYAALGSDTGGSIRFPAACCGVVGLKATFGRVSRHGIFPLAGSLDHVGPMARRVRDAALMLDAIAGPDPRDPACLTGPAEPTAPGIETFPAGVRVGVDEAYCSDHVDPVVREAVMAAVDVLRRLGADVRTVALPPMAGLLRDFNTWVAVEAALAHSEWFPARADEYGDGLRALLEDGLKCPATGYARVRAAGQTFAGELARLFEDVDVIACPSWPVPAPPVAPTESLEEIVDEAGNMLKFTGPFNASGNPTLSVPCGFSSDGLPLSLQLVGRHMEEAQILRLGHAYEQATDWHERTPPLAA